MRSWVLFANNVEVVLFKKFISVFQSHYFQTNDYVGKQLYPFSNSGGCYGHLRIIYNNINGFPSDLAITDFGIRNSNTLAVTALLTILRENSCMGVKTSMRNFDIFDTNLDDEITKYVESWRCVE